MIRRALAVLALCAAAATAGEEEKFVVVPNPALPGEVPEGSREDQILWRDARDAMVQGNDTVKAANMALYDLHYARLNLDQLAKDQDAKPADRERLKALGARLDGPAKAVDAAIPRGPLGRCRYEIMYFEQSMQFSKTDPQSDGAKRLPEKRTEARKCKEDHQKVIATLGPAVKELRAALDEVGPEIRQRMAAQAAKSGPAKDAPKDPGAKDPAKKDAPAKPGSVSL
jgi:hypothetical protein